MERYAFKAGEEVPQWVEKTDNCKAIFGVDCEVIRYDSGVTVIPMHDEYEYVINVSSDDPNKEHSVSGAPTTIYANGKPGIIEKRA